MPSTRLNGDSNSPIRQPMKTKLLSHLLSLAFVLGTAACLFCQAVSARLEGTVFDPSKAVVAKAVVTATNQDTGATTSLTSSERGAYVFANILPGRYIVAVEVPGFKRLESRDLVLQIGDARKLDLDLQQGTVTESVDVVSEVPSVDTATTKIGAVVDNRQAVD